MVQKHWKGNIVILITLSESMEKHFKAHEQHTHPPSSASPNPRAVAMYTCGQATFSRNHFCVKNIKQAAQRRHKWGPLVLWGRGGGRSSLHRKWGVFSIQAAAKWAMLCFWWPCKSQCVSFTFQGYNRVPCPQAEKCWTVYTERVQT